MSRDLLCTGLMLAASWSAVAAQPLPPQAVEDTCVLQNWQLPTDNLVQAPAQTLDQALKEVTEVLGRGQFLTSPELLHAAEPFWQPEAGAATAGTSELRVAEPFWEPERQQPATAGGGSVEPFDVEDSRLATGLTQAASLTGNARPLNTGQMQDLMADGAEIQIQLRQLPFNASNSNSTLSNATNALENVLVAAHLDFNRPLFSSDSHIIPAMVLSAVLFAIIVIWVWDLCCGGPDDWLPEIPRFLQVSCTFFFLYAAAGFVMLWKFGWIQPVIEKCIVYLFLITMVLVPIMLCLHHHVSRAWHHGAHFCEQVYDKFDDVTDMLGITEMSDSDFEDGGMGCMSKSTQAKLGFKKTIPSKQAKCPSNRRIEKTEKKKTAVQTGL